MTGFLAMMAFRGYFHSLKLLDKKLKATNFDEVQSACCQLGHVNAAGHAMMCDREVVKQCVAIWFGSTVAFEELVRSDVSEIVATELRQNVFTRGWALQVSAPVLWGFMDIVASHIRVAIWNSAFEYTVTGLVVWLLVAPMIVELVLFLTRRYCSQATSRICGPFADFLLKLAMWVMVAAFVGLLCAIFLVIRFVPYELPWVRSAAFGGAMLMISIFIYALKRAFQAPKSLRSAGTDGGSKVSL